VRRVQRTSLFPLPSTSHQSARLTPTVAEIAYAHAAIQTREVHNSTFRYAKTLTLPFFGSGMVDLPPQGQKKKKNSRKMQMVFFVFYGRVVVEVAGNVFSIGKGGMWQVPRGWCLPPLRYCPVSF